MTDIMITARNKIFEPLDLKPEQVRLFDIAHALSNICRYGGHCPKFYSVAQHSMRVAALLPRELRLQGLLHDATEAYVMDLPSPIKRNMPGYRNAENRAWLAICERLNIPVELDPLVKQADEQMLWTEMHEIFNSKVVVMHMPEHFQQYSKAQFEEPLAPEEAKQRFHKALMEEF